MALDLNTRLLFMGLDSPHSSEEGFICKHQTSIGKKIIWYKIMSHTHAHTPWEAAADLVSYEAQRLILKPGDEKGQRGQTCFWAALSFSWCSRCFPFLGSITFTPVVPVGVKSQRGSRFPLFRKHFGNRSTFIKDQHELNWT